MSLLENSYVFANLLINALLKCFLWILLHFRKLNINKSYFSADIILKIRLAVYGFYIM